jgi:hypothetical protein
MRALARANQVRLARAELKRGVAFGRVDVAEVILYCPWEAQSMAVADLLMSQHRWGQTRSRKFLTRIPMSEKKTVGSMTERQRRSLAAMLVSTDPSGAWSEAWLADRLVARSPQARAEDEAPTLAADRASAHDPGVPEGVAPGLRPHAQPVRPEPRRDVRARPALSLGRA